MYNPIRMHSLSRDAYYACSGKAHSMDQGVQGATHSTQTSITMLEQDKGMKSVTINSYSKCS